MSGLFTAGIDKVTVITPASSLIKFTLTEGVVERVKMYRSLEKYGDVPPDDMTFEAVTLDKDKWTLQGGSTASKEASLIERELDLEMDLANVNLHEWKSMNEIDCRLPKESSIVVLKIDTEYISKIIDVGVHKNDFFAKSSSFLSLIFDKNNGIVAAPRDCYRFTSADHPMQRIDDDVELDSGIELRAWRRRIYVKQFLSGTPAIQRILNSTEFATGLSVVHLILYWFPRKQNLFCAANWSAASMLQPFAVEKFSKQIALENMDEMSWRKKAQLKLLELSVPTFPCKMHVKGRLRMNSKLYAAMKNHVIKDTKGGILVYYQQRRNLATGESTMAGKDSESDLSTDDEEDQKRVDKSNFKIGCKLPLRIDVGVGILRIYNTDATLAITEIMEYLDTVEY